MSGIKIELTTSPRYKKIIGANYEDYTEKALLLILAEAEKISKKEAPVKTGNLRRSIGIRKTNKLEGAVVTNVNYWIYLQWGTSRMKPNPFVTRTADEVVGRKIFSNSMKKVLKANGVE